MNIGALPNMSDLLGTIAAKYQDLNAKLLAAHAATATGQAGLENNIDITESLNDLGGTIDYYA